MKLLTLEHLLKLHALVIEETGGSTGLRDLGRLESAVATQTQNVFEEELYPDLVAKAAALIADDPFVDGNKRTAMLTSLTFLKINQVAVNIREHEIEDFAVRVAVEKLDVNTISRWLKQKLA